MAEATEITETPAEAPEPVSPSEPEPQSREAQPAAPDDTPAPRQPIQFVSDPEPMPGDEVETALELAINAIDTDEMLSSGQKAAERARLLAQKVTYRTGREDRQRQLVREDWDQEAADRGASAEKLRNLWAQARAKAAQELPRANAQVRDGAAIVFYRQLADGLKKEPESPTASEQPARQTPTRQVGTTRAIPRGTPSAPPVPQKKLTVSEMIEQGKLPEHLAKQVEAELMQ